MATNPATEADLQSRSFRELNPSELAVGSTLLGDAWAMIVSAIPSVESRLDAEPPQPLFRSLVVQTLCAMVLRVLNNPDGKLEERHDDYQYRLDSAVSTGALYLSDAEYGRLTEGDNVSTGAFTIRPKYGALTTPPDLWWPL